MRFGQIEEEMARLQQKAAQVEEAESLMQDLRESGLLKQNADGGLEGVGSWEEHQQIMQQRLEES